MLCLTGDRDGRNLSHSCSAVTDRTDDPRHLGSSLSRELFAGSRNLDPLPAGTFWRAGQGSGGRHCWLSPDSGLPGLR